MIEAKIPKIIHQIRIGPKKPPLDLIATWQSMNPTWQHMLWNDDLIQQHYPKGFKNQRLIDEITEWAGKADIMRYEILHDFGGFYIDADSICINALDEFFIESDCFAGFENEQARGNLVANGYIGAVKGCELMKILSEEISKKQHVSQEKTGKMAWQTVGPLFFTETIIKYSYPIDIYPSYVFIPEHYSGLKYSGNGKSYAHQLWGSTKELTDPNFYNNLTHKQVNLVKLDITALPVYYINLAQAKERDEHMQSMLTRLGFTNINRVEAIKHENKVIGCALSHIASLNQIKDDIFLLLEDDVADIDFVKEIEVPEDFDAYYIGTSYRANDINRAKMSIMKSSTTKVKVAENSYRITNMLALHAVIYKNRDYRAKCAQIAQDYLTDRTGNLNCDVPIAEEQKNWNIYAIGSPLFYQEDKNNPDNKFWTIKPLKEFE